MDVEFFFTAGDSRRDVSISFIKRQANMTVHLMTKVPCSLYSFKFFMSPPNILLCETLMLDSNLSYKKSISHHNQGNTI